MKLILIENANTSLLPSRNSKKRMKSSGILAGHNVLVKTPDAQKKQQQNHERVRPKIAGEKHSR